MCGSLPSTPLLLHLTPPWLAWAHLYGRQHDSSITIIIKRLPAHDELGTCIMTCSSLSCLTNEKTRFLTGMPAIRPNFAWQIWNCFLFAGLLCTNFSISILQCNLSCKLSIKAQQEAFAAVLSAFSSSDAACAWALWACCFLVTAPFQQPMLQTHRVGALQCCRGTLV